MRLDGVSLKDAAAQCEMSRTTVIAAVKAYHAGGWKDLDVERSGRPQGICASVAFLTPAPAASAPRSWP
ncbi:MAG: helix-turn-helix domain-containing protein [Candidatus Protistobacter heckmanni]|nr:helix-turn-helix domain-containing protein [Candidatus Protistobacter heckmanni]